VRRLLRLILAACALIGLGALLKALFEGRGNLVGVSPAGWSDANQSPASDTNPLAGNGAAELTRDELYEQAKRLNIEGRSKMSKTELLRAVEQREASRS
jgi:hypothetical protein